LSRSALIAEALRSYLRQRRRERISDQLKQADADVPSADERRLVRRLRTKIPVQDRW